MPLLRYEWLYKADCEGFKSPPIEISASSHHIRLSLGESGKQSKINPLLHLRDMLEKYTDVDCAIKVTAKLDAGLWPLEQGFRRLGEYLGYIGNEEIGFKHWTELNIDLPSAEPLDFAYSPNRSGHLLAPNALANLKRLAWSGHREQLIASWLPFTPSLLDTLTNLILCCDLALTDCSYILHHGRQLKELTVRTLRRDIAHCPVLSQQIHASDTPHLITLTLRSDDDLVPWLTQCKFASLRHLDLDLLYPTASTFPLFKLWSNLETINLSGDLKQEEVNWIGSQYIHMHVHHVFIPGLAVFHCTTSKC
ncbi:hypothetical protein C0992_002359 [Termitomyces sp. T32_za158]|nr:hypothetical protein C0992_002359 [Termitomyces sp. T32_za158]